MTVQELIKDLQLLDPDRIVVMAGDAEGNFHCPLAGFWEGAYKPDTTWSGEVGLEKLTDEDRERGYSEDDVVEGEKALILVPLN